jgi:hypothetical protein
MTPQELYAKYPNPGIPREAAVVREILSGNVPRLNQPLIPLSMSILVAADYLAFGTDDNWCRCPLTPFAAQYVATALGYKLPTPALVDVIYTCADVKLSPLTEPWNYVEPVSGTLSTRFLQHSGLVDQQILKQIGQPASLNQLVAGHKKDVVSTPLLSSHPEHVAIYGWQVDEHHVIQPLTTVHDWNYSDYSHGIRFVQCDDPDYAGPCSLDAPPAEFLALVKAA